MYITWRLSLCSGTYCNIPQYINNKTPELWSTYFFYVLVILITTVWTDLRLSIVLLNFSTDCSHLMCSDTTFCCNVNKFHWSRIWWMLHGVGSTLLLLAAEGFFSSQTIRHFDYFLLKECSILCCFAPCSNSQQCSPNIKWLSEQWMWCFCSLWWANPQNSAPLQELKSMLRALSHWWWHPLWYIWCPTKTGW
jgi:hypothetical protein